MQYMCSRSVNINNVNQQLMCTIQFQNFLVAVNLPNGIFYSKDEK